MTDPTDFRALCARLLDALEEVRFGPYPGYIRCIIDDARTALSQPAPLWRVMHDAAIEVSKTSVPIASRRGFAAEIRAIVGEMQLRWGEELPDASELPGDVGMEIVHWLIAEADRAEAGE